MLQPHRVIAANVLDAWFPPLMAVRDALAHTYVWNLNTSPPTYSEGLVATIKAYRGLEGIGVLPGPGSSALIYLVMQRMAGVGTRVLIPEPCYVEYAHVSGALLGCKVSHLVTHESDDFRLDLDQWVDTVLRECVDLAVLVNPNNPTGICLSTDCIEHALEQMPATTRVIIDEAYIDFAGGSSSDRLIARFPNLLVLKSLSKCFALSGARVAYLAGDEDLIAELRGYSPPWWVSLPAQIAAMAAFTDLSYYQEMYCQTATLRQQLVARLGNFAFTCFGTGNWVLARVPTGTSASDWVQSLRARSIYIRNAGSSAPTLGDEYVRIAVRGQVEQDSILSAVESMAHPIRTIPV
ncbi:MAG TPA: histidinol-phosphate transaminase [Fimbriimonas sp.]|nr:histidinol-phosphate transaminase [Fimbriimonas sp.]